MKKTIICIWNTAKKGKTETVRELAKLILKNYPNFECVSSGVCSVPDKGDFQFAIKVKDKIIGFISQGDPGTGLDKKLKRYATKYECNIIICTTRTHGATVQAVRDIANNYDYEKIWTSTYHVSDINKYSIINKLKAKHLLDLIQELKLI